MVELAVALTEVWPCALVCAADVRVALAPVAGALNVTVWLGTGLPWASFTTTSNALPKAALICALCGVPLTTAIDAGTPAVLVRAKVAGVATPATGAAMFEGPPMGELAVALTEVWPCALVCAAAVRVALAPVAGAVNVTVWLGTGLPWASFTTTSNALPKAALICAFCGVPLTTAIVAGAPTVLVRAKVAGVATPATEAVTL